MNARKTAVFTLLSASLAIPLAFGATPSIRILEGPFRTLLEMLRNETIVLGFTIIFFFMLLYGIYSTGLRFVPAFKGEHGLSRQGKVVGVALSGLSTLAIFYSIKPMTPQQLLATTLDPFGIFGGFALAALFAGITYFGIRGESNTRSLALTAGAAGFGMVIAGLITTRDSIMAWGWFIMLIAMIFGLVFRNWGQHPHGEQTPLGETPQGQLPPGQLPQGQIPGLGQEGAEAAEPRADGAMPIIQNVNVNENNIEVTFFIR